MRFRQIGPITIGPGHIQPDPYYSTWINWGGSKLYYNSFSYNLSSASTLEVKRCWDELHLGPPYRDGGPFDLWSFKTDAFTPKGSLVSNQGIYGAEVYGHFHALPPSSYLDWVSLDAFIADDDATNAEPWGATGWAKFSPTRPSWNLATTIWHLADTASMFRSVAEAFYYVSTDPIAAISSFSADLVARATLMYQLGWKSYLSNLRSFLRQLVYHERQLNQLRRSNGKWVRRSGSVRHSESTGCPVSQTGSVGLHPALVTPHYNAPLGSQTVTKYDLDDIWFEGAFRFWVPGGPQALDMRLLAMMYGFNAIPSLLWKLVPWHMIINWCTNLDDIIFNASSMLLDNLCARYAYIMRHRKQKATYYGTNNYKVGPVSASWFAQYESKRRVPASPFGFGLTPGDFTLRQKSILLALGLLSLS